MEKLVITNENEAKYAIEVAIDKVFEDRLYEFIHNLMLEAEDKVEELYDVSILEERCDIGERWCDSLRDETINHINKKVIKMYNN